MCVDPATMTALTLMKVTAAMSAASAAMSYMQGNATADAQTEALQRNKDMQDADLARAQEEQQQAGAAQMNEQARNAMRDMALFDTVAGEFGGGVTADRGLSSMAIRQGESMATIGKNQDASARQGSFQSLALQSQTNSQLASISRPSLLGTALTIASSAASYGQSAQSLKKTPGVN